MKKLLLLLVFGFMTAYLSAQETVQISFKNSTETFERNPKSMTYPVTIKADVSKIKPDDLKLYTLTVQQDDEQSTLPKKGYTLDFNSVTLDKIKAEYTFFLTVKPDSLIDRDRDIYLTLAIKKNDKTVLVNSESTNLILHVIVKPYQALNRYNYLGYVGTNFDLVDGVQAKNLFFATSIFVSPPLKGKGFGFNLTLYGNRSLTLTDTSGNARYATQIVPLPGDSARTYYAEALKIRYRVTDNLGASFSPLIRMGSRSANPERETQVFYAPQFEFIWRRTKLTTSYTNINVVDSTDRANRPISAPITLTPEKEIIPLNVYDVYLGALGFLLKHENENISVRLQTSMGVNYSYTAIQNGKVESILHIPYERQWNIFFFARAWVIEPRSGLTFGAEVSNNFLKSGSHQPYFNVTLSKALNLSALGTIFQPVGR